MKRDIELDQLRIASPCHMDWERMDVQGGEENVRHCGSCDRHVYNISGMSSAEARRLIDEAGAGGEGRLCVRLYLRADGTVLTSDCPVGRRAARWARAKVAAWALLIAGALTGTAAAVWSSADANAAMSGASGGGSGWIYQTRAYQAFQRWLNPTPPGAGAGMMVGRPAMGAAPVRMGEWSGPVVGKPGPTLGMIAPTPAGVAAPDPGEPAQDEGEDAHVDADAAAADSR